MDSFLYRYKKSTAQVLIRWVHVRIMCMHTYAHCIPDMPYFNSVTFMKHTPCRQLFFFFFFFPRTSKQYCLHCYHLCCDYSFSQDQSECLLLKFSRQYGCHCCH